MPPELYADRFRYTRKGFRTKISGQWFVFRRGEAMPIFGPFQTKPTEQEIAAMAKKETTKVETTKEETDVAKKGSDPSDAENAEHTTTGDETGDDGGDETGDDDK